MCTDFVLLVKCIIFWLNIGLRVYLDLYVPDFPKSIPKYFFISFFSFFLFLSKTPSFGGVFVNKNTQNMKKTIVTKKMENLVKNIFVIWVWKSLNDWAAQNIFFFYIYFCKKQVLRGTFGEIWSIQIQIYLKTYVELKYCACYLKKEVSAHRLGLVVQLSWRVAPPCQTPDFPWTPSPNKWSEWLYIRAVVQLASCAQRFLDSPWPDSPA